MLTEREYCVRCMINTEIWHCLNILLQSLTSLVHVYWNVLLFTDRFCLLFIIAVSIEDEIKMYNLSSEIENYILKNKI